jgi:hypothetical protein
MERILIIILRVLFALVLGLFGTVALMQGVSMLAFRDFILFGWPGAMMLVGVLFGAGLLYGSWRLFRTTLALHRAEA